MTEVIADSIHHEFIVHASAKRVFTALTSELGAWWTHSFRTEKKVLFEPVVGGRFYEDWGSGTGALYATVMYIEPSRQLRMSGPMGMSGAVVSAMTFTLSEEAESTKLTLVHDIFGTISRATIEEYREGWKELLGTTLKEYCESK